MSPRGKVRRVAVLGSGTVREGSRGYRQAEKLGAALAGAGFAICHGGYGGVMEAVAKGCRESGGTNTGITIGKSLAHANPYADVEIKMPSWEKRLLKLIEMGNAYVFLDGATGTLNELFFIWEMANKKLHAKPVILLGARLHKLVKFLRKDPALKIPRNFHSASSIVQVMNFLKAGDSVERRAFSV